jgi:hypothetical protein
VNDKVIEFALESGLASEMENGMYWIDAGPIDIHLERFYEFAFEAGRIVGFKQDRALTELARIGQEIEQAHTDHPMQHWDRTCPACVADQEPQEFVRWSKEKEFFEAARTPSRKKWVGLTEDEIKHYNNRLSGSNVAQEIESKLRERNT